MMATRRYLVNVAVAWAVLSLVVSCGLAHPVAQTAPAPSGMDSATVSVQSSEPMTTGPYPVSKVVDGDTLWVQRDGKDVKLRLIGIDTPETHDPRKPAQCFGAAATTKAQTVLTGHRVLLETDKSQGLLDRYGRELVYVWVDGNLFNQQMIEGGFAHEYTYSTPYRYQRQFKEAERMAADAGVGLWATDTCGGDTTQRAAGGG